MHYLGMKPMALLFSNALTLAQRLACTPTVHEFSQTVNFVCLYKLRNESKLKSAVYNKSVYLMYKCKCADSKQLK